MDFTANKTNSENLDQQVKSMMNHSDNANPLGKGKSRVCEASGMWKGGKDDVYKEPYRGKSY